MFIEHIAVYTKDLEAMKTFYETYFGAKANDKYHNPRTGLQTYFLSFEDGSRLELMTRPSLEDGSPSMQHLGYVHLAFCVGNKEEVNRLTDTLAADGYSVISKPRTTGDGYYESCVLDPEGNQIELVALKS